jgi:hypothetical protein
MLHSILFAVVFSNNFMKKKIDYKNFLFAPRAELFNKRINAS